MADTVRGLFGEDAAIIAAAERKTQIINAEFSDTDDKLNAEIQASEAKFREYLDRKVRNIENLFEVNSVELEKSIATYDKDSSIRTFSSISLDVERSIGKDKDEAYEKYRRQNPHKEGEEGPFENDRVATRFRTTASNNAQQTALYHLGKSDNANGPQRYFAEQVDQYTLLQENKLAIANAWRDPETRAQIDGIIRSDIRAVLENGIPQKEVNDLTFGERVGVAFLNLHLEKSIEDAIVFRYGELPITDIFKRVNTTIAAKLSEQFELFTRASILDANPKDKDKPFGDPTTMTLLFEEYLGELIKPAAMEGIANSFVRKAMKEGKGTIENPFEMDFEVVLGLPAGGKGYLGSTLVKVFKEVERIAQLEQLELKTEAGRYIMKKIGGTKRMPAGTGSGIKRDITNPNEELEEIWAPFTNWVELATNNGIYLNHIPGAHYLLEVLRLANDGDGANVIEGDVWPFGKYQMEDRDKLIEVIQRKFADNGMVANIQSRSTMLMRLSPDQVDKVLANRAESAKASGLISSVLRRFEGETKSWPQGDTAEVFDQQISIFHQQILPAVQAEIDKLSVPLEKEIAELFMLDLKNSVTNGLASRRKEATDLGKSVRRDDMPDIYVTRGRSAAGSAQGYLVNENIPLTIIPNDGVDIYNTIIEMMQRLFGDDAAIDLVKKAVENIKNPQEA